MDAVELVERYTAGLRDFSQVNLHDADLSEAFLVAINVSGASLVDANLCGCCWRGAKLVDATLRGAML
jgi:uncharacterized protein YjbI with pentapeptide repeats